MQDPFRNNFSNLTKKLKRTILIFYRQHTKYGEGNVFIHVCHSVNHTRGGGLHSHNAMGRQTNAPPPKGQTPQESDTATGYGRQAVGAHPNGMYPYS